MPRNLLKSVGKAISKAASFGVSGSAPPEVKRLLEKYGNQKIVQMSVARKPIISLIKKVVDLLANEVYDKLFHLFIIVKLENGVELKLERNQRINFTQSLGLTPDTEIIEVPINKDITLSEFITKANKRQGDLYWKYSSSSNNCQDFVFVNLSVNGLMTPQLKTFVKQDTKNLLPKWVQSVSDTITDAAASVDSVVQGGSKRKMLVSF